MQVITVKTVAVGTILCVFRAALEKRKDLIQVGRKLNWLDI